MPQPPSDPNDFSPRKKPSGSESPKVYAFIKPDMEVSIDEQEMTVDLDIEIEKVCRCDQVCTCNTVSTGRMTCRCDTVSRCTCESVQTCSCDTVGVCSCDTVAVCRCETVCGCDSHSPGGGGTRVCRCVPVRAH